MAPERGLNEAHGGRGEGWSVSEYEGMERDIHAARVTTGESMAVVDAIDPIQELEDELARSQVGPVQLVAGSFAARRASLPASVAPVSGSQSDAHPPASSDAKADGSSVDGQAEANFNAWRTARIALDGMDATFEVEIVDSDGKGQTLDLRKVTFEELPDSLKAEFESRRVPDLARWVRARQSTPIEAAGKDKPSAEPSTEASSLRQPGDGQAPADHHVRSSRPRPSPHREDAAGDLQSQGRVRTAAPAGFGVGLSLGGLAEGAGRAVEGAGRVIQGAGHAASGALAYMQASMRGLANRQHGRALKHVQRWREDRAASALELLQRAMKDFETSLETARARPDLKDAFRSWDAATTQTGRAKALERFREMCTTGRYCEHVQAVVADLMKQAEALRTHAEQSLGRVKTARQDCEPLRKRLRGWLERMADRAGPLSGASGESLAGTLKELAEAVGQMLTGLVQRMAQFAGQRLS